MGGGGGGARAGDGDAQKEPLLPTQNSHLKFPTNVAATFCDYVERAIVWYYDDYGSKRKHGWFEGNFAPTTEMAPQGHLRVTGTIPDCMNGEFVRVGPNPRFFPPTGGIHWFDGDGMLHGLKMKDGQATYVARYVRTSRLEQEEKFGAPKFLKFGDFEGVKGLMYAFLEQLRIKLGVLDDSNGKNQGNTSLVFHGGKFMALNEGDKPYIIKVLEDGDFETMGQESYGGRLGRSMTAHPKLDSVTGELFAFGYQLSSPYVYYHVISKEGVMSKACVITLPRAVLMHDFAITENFAIFMDLPLILDPEAMAKGGIGLRFDEKKEARFGVLPRYATNESELKWFTIPPCTIFHNANAWEEGDEIVLYSCRQSERRFSFLLEDSSPQSLYEFRMNLKTGEVKQKKMGELNIDFPNINEKYVGRKNSYVYGCLFGEGLQGVGIAKYNLHKEPQFGLGETVGGNVEGLFLYGPGRFAGEAKFVPRSTDPEIEEDDGYLIAFVHDENNGISEVVIIDAKTMAAEPVAVVTMPRRVPYGFHAMFVPEEQLKEQLETLRGVQAS